MVAKPVDLIEKDPGLLARVVTTIVIMVVSLGLALYTIWAVWIDKQFGKTEIFNTNGTTSHGNIAWFPWAAPILVLAALGLILLFCAAYYFKVLWPQIKGR